MEKNFEIFEIYKQLPAKFPNPYGPWKTNLVTFPNVPIELLERFRKTAKEQNQKVRVKFRGPRRPRAQFGYIGQSVCLKKDATAFTAYLI